MRAALLVLAIALPLQAFAAGVQPLVIERYDAIAFVQEATDQRNWEVHRVYFIRAGRVIADRIVVEDMLLGVRPGCFSLSWSDYGSCQRVIYAPSLFTMRIEHAADYDSRGEGSPWWGMGRRMTDLEAPPEDE